MAQHYKEEKKFRKDLVEGKIQLPEEKLSARRLPGLGGASKWKAARKVMQAQKMNVRTDRVVQIKSSSSSSSSSADSREAGRSSGKKDDTTDAIVEVMLNQANNPLFSQLFVVSGERGSVKDVDLLE